MRLARHSMTLAWRSLWHTRRTPEELIDVTLQPILFLTIFTFIFGGAIAHGSQHDYLQFVLPGLLGQSIALGSERKRSNTPFSRSRLRLTPSATLPSAIDCPSRPGSTNCR